MAIAAALLGVVAALGSLLAALGGRDLAPGVGLALGLFALVLGATAKRDVERSRGRERGRAAAIAGMCLGGLACVVVLAWYIVLMLS
jgi:hypothetical protein